MGGNTTIYSVVHHLLTAPAPGVEAHGARDRRHSNPAQFLVEPYMSYANYLDYGARARSVQRTAGCQQRALYQCAQTRAAMQYSAGLVTGGYFDTLGVRITLGRALREDDDRLVAGGLPAVISDRLWRDRFHRDATIVGRRITLNGNAAIVVGVAAPRFLGAHC